MRLAALEVDEVVEHLLAGERVVQRDAPGQVAGQPPDLDRVGDDVHAEHAGTAAGGVQEAEERADRRRLAGAVRAQEAEDLALSDFEGQVGERLDDP